MAARSPRYVPDKQRFMELARPGCVVPVWREVLADRLTPVSAYERVAHSAPSFLLESVEGGERLARYSFLGCDPEIVVRTREGQVAVDRQGSVRRTTLPSNLTPLGFVADLVGEREWIDPTGLPRFAGGAVGFASYDLVRYLERIPSLKPDVLGLDDAGFMVTRSLLAFDHVRHRIIILCNAIVSSDAEIAYADAVARIETIAEALRTPHALPDASAPSRPGTVTQSLQRAEFEDIVRRCKEYIHAGDAFQIVPSVRFSVPVTCSPFELYRALRSINPSPYMYFLDFGDFQIVGSSPEILATVENRKVRVRPIAGTRHRGCDDAEDQRLEHELLADPKERAEHIMLVDLGRNDVGRVSRYGTVRVDDLMTIERYSHVMHIVSNVTGELADGVRTCDAVEACFPAGTLTGAPKVRAMEIIEEMEPSRRGLYGGAVGYFSFRGDADFAIAIRTMVIKDGVAHIQAGAGIVADSDPAREYEECVNKAGALLSAVSMAHDGLD